MVIFDGRFSMGDSRLVSGERERSRGTPAERPPDSDEAFLALGSNQGDRRAALRGAVRAMAGAAPIEGVGVSPVYETEAHTRRPDEAQPAYLNAVVQLRMECSPETLLKRAWQWEVEAGRDRQAEEGRWQPRPLDVDLLVVGRVRRRTARLTLPHPRLAERRFVLRPWADLAPNLRVPAPFETTVETLLARCRDCAALRRAAPPPSAL